MEDINLSSCSFLSDNEDNQAEQQMSQTEIQNLTLQNERLTEVNNQLQSSLETLKNQLRDAIEAVNSTKGMSEQIQGLKQQLAESNEKREKLQSQLKEKSLNGTEVSNKYNQEIENLTQEKDQALQQLQALTEQKNKLRSDKSALRKSIEDQSLANENLLAENEKLKADKKKQRTKMNALIEQTSQLESAVEQINGSLQKEKNEKATLSQECDALKMQLSEAKRTMEEQKNQIALLSKEIQEKQEANAMIESQLDEQREEIDCMTKEKQKIITLMHTMSAALSASETMIEDLGKEKTSILAKNAQKASRSSSSFSRSDVLDLNIPFQGDLGENCQKILKLPQYQPIQRIQLIINESAKHIVEAENETNNAKQTAAKAETDLKLSQDKTQQYVQVLNALLNDLKELSISEANISKCTPCNSDSRFISYITEKCAQLDPMVRDKVLADPHFISNDFFFTNDITKKKNEIQSLCEQNETTFAILAAQFISNTILKNQINSMIYSKENCSSNSIREESVHSQASQLSQRSKNSQQSQASVHSKVSHHTQASQHLSEQGNMMHPQEEKLAKLTQVCRKLKLALKKAQQSQMELQKLDSDQKAKISQLQIQYDNIKNELDVTNMKLQVANNEITSRTTDSFCISSSASQIREIPMQKANDTKAAELEEDLKNKTKECAQLSMQLKKAQADFVAKMAAKTKQFKKQEDMLNNEIVSLHEQIDLLFEEKQQKKKVQKKKDKVYEAQCETKIHELTASFEEAKENLNKTIEQLNEKSKQAQEASEALMAQIADYEQKNQKAQQDNAALIANQKKAQVELNQMKQQINKEKQNLQGQLSAQMMVYDTKLQKAIKEAKEETEKAVEELLQIAQNSLGSLYDLEDGDFTKDTFVQLIELVKADLDKLHYFQTETTKYVVEKNN